MGWSIKLGRVFGIDVKMHFTFLLILVWGAFAYGGNAGPLYGVIVTLGLFTLVFLHELGHSLAAMIYGIQVKDITLLPIGGVARLERMPEKPIQELIVALDGLPKEHEHCASLAVHTMVQALRNYQEKGEQ